MHLVLDPLAPSGYRLVREGNAVISVGSSGSNGGVQSVVAGTNVTVDNTDPANPIVSASGGSSTQTYSQFVYNSSGPQTGNRYNDWADLMAVKNDEDGYIMILFEQDEVIPVGDYDLSQTTLIGNGVASFTSQGYNITFQEGTTFTGYQSMTWAGGLVFRLENTTPLINTLGNSPDTIANIYFDNVYVRKDAVGNGSLLDHYSGLINLFLSETILDTAFNGDSLFNLTTDGVDIGILYLFQGLSYASVFTTDHVISGDSGVWGNFVINAAVDASWKIPQVLPAAFEQILVRAFNVSFDNSSTQLASIEVQAAIQEIEGGKWVTSSTGGATTIRMQSTPSAILYDVTIDDSGNIVTTAV